MVKKSILWSVVLALAAFAVGCGPKIYVTPDFESYRQTEKSVAVLPFVVTIDPKKLPKDFTPEMAEKAELEEGVTFQQQLYMRFLERHKKGEYSVDFQDVDKTNALLGKQGINSRNIGNYTKEELHQILGVDALISGTIYRAHPMSTGTAVVLGVLFGAWGSTNEVNVAMNIHDGASGELLWKYEHKASGSVGSSTENLAASLMKNVSKKFPYKNPENQEEPIQSELSKKAMQGN